MKKHFVEKHYPHSLGLSACFRQWRATSHCRHLHGYALAFTIRFESDALSPEGWVVDFGALKPVREFLFETFDHKVLVSTADPMRDDLLRLARSDLAVVVDVVGNVGCEAFANIVLNHTQRILLNSERWRHVIVSRVTCHEHDANSATVIA
jgi:6-pyruvoyltetrahydropterin/6-carboxytetrahydropterin synthase